MGILWVCEELMGLCGDSVGLSEELIQMCGDFVGLCEELM